MIDFEEKYSLKLPHVFKLNCLSQKKIHLIPKLNFKDLKKLHYIYVKIKDKNKFHQILGINVQTAYKIIKTYKKMRKLKLVKDSGLSCNEEEEDDFVIE